MPDDVDPLAAARRLAESGDLDSAIAALRRVDEAASTGAARLPWARLALELGLLEDAGRALSLARAEAPDDRAVEAECRALSGLIGSPLPEQDPTSTDEPSANPLGAASTAPTASTAPSEADLVRFLHLFGGRSGVHARQWVARDAAGRPTRVGYAPIREPITPRHLAAHLAGRETLGIYPVRADDTVNLFVLDLDITRRALDTASRSREEARRLRALLGVETRRILRHAAGLGLELVPEDSGYKGRHFWGFLERPLPADLVHRLGVRLRRALRPADAGLAVEFFPKQRAVGPDGLGNLVKLPLGVHRRSGRWARLLDGEGRPHADPWRLVREAPRIGREAVLAALTALRGPAATGPAQPDRQAGEAAMGATSAGPVRDETMAPIERRPVEVLRGLPAINRLETGCAVLRRLVDRAVETRRLTYDEQIVLRHALGHFDPGVELANQLFESCPEVAPHTFLGRALRGHPISCARIRERIPHITAEAPCHCAFDGVSSHYPTPLLHVEEPR